MCCKKIYDRRCLVNELIFQETLKMLCLGLQKCGLKVLLGIMKILLVFCVTLVVLLGVPAGSVSGEEEVSFSWAFFLRPEDGQVKSLDFKTPEPVSDGELLRIYLELHGQAFVYLYLRDAKEDLYLVFPPNGSFYNGGVPAGYKSYIPSGHEWFALDDAQGTERFYLLASSKRLFELERLTDRFLMVGGDSLKLQLQEKVSDTVERFGDIPVGAIDQVLIYHGEWLSLANLPPLVSSHKISTTGAYGVILEMVNIRGSSGDEQ